MRKIKFSSLDPYEKLAVFWLAEQAETLTTNITSALSHKGEIWEAAGFMTRHIKGDTAHAALAARLRLSDKSTESIMACIKRTAPAYQSVTEWTDAELDELLATLKGTPGY